MKNFQKIYNNISSYPTIQKIANKLGISERTVRRKATKLREEGTTLIDRGSSIRKKVEDLETTDLQTEIQIRQLQDNITILKRKLKEAHKEVNTSQALRDMIHETKNITLDDVPDWLNRKQKKRKSLTGIPVLFLSDIHFDEVVERGQVSNVNVYNRKIAEERIKYTFETARSLLIDYMTDAKYDGFVLALGGDMLSGNIHEELAESNEVPILQSVFRLTELLISGIESLVDEFGKVFIPCVVGNHGRLTQNKRYKNKQYDNFEWIIYQNIAKYFSNNKNVTVYIPESPDAQFTIYNTRFLLEHGDAYRGGSGIAGIFSPLMLGAHRKSKNKNAVNKPFDIMMIGHFHQYIHTNNLIVNGSVKGYDEYAYNNNFAFEQPQQSLFIVHPTFGITFRMPIRCDGYAIDDKKNENNVKIVF